MVFLSRGCAGSIGPIAANTQGGNALLDERSHFYGQYNGGSSHRITLEFFTLSIAGDEYFSAMIVFSIDSRTIAAMKACTVGA